MQTEITDRGADVIEWRRGQLIEAGFASATASSLAGDPRYDLHALIELVEQGCPPELAVRILAPLGGVEAT
jgi:hypothetical protein